MALKITDQNYKEIVSQNSVVLIDLWAEWCGPCKSIAPVIDELATELEGKAVIGKYDVDDENDLSVDYKVRSIPTLLFFKDGEMVDKIVGASSKADIKAKLESLM